MVEKSDESDEWQVIRQTLSLSMLDSSNFVRLFHRQSFALYGTSLSVTVRASLVTKMMWRRNAKGSTSIISRREM